MPKFIALKCLHPTSSLILSLWIKNSITWVDTRWLDLTFLGSNQAHPFINVLSVADFTHNSRDATATITSGSSQTTFSNPNFVIF